MGVWKQQRNYFLFFKCRTFLSACGKRLLLHLDPVYFIKQCKINDLKMCIVPKVFCKSSFANMCIKLCQVQDERQLGCLVLVVSIRVMYSSIAQKTFGLISVPYCNKKEKHQNIQQQDDVQKEQQIIYQLPEMLSEAQLNFQKHKSHLSK